MKTNTFRPLVLSAAGLLAVSTAFGNAFTAPDGPVRKEVKEVRPLNAVLKDAKAIDAILQKAYAKHEVTPLPAADDATLVRRAYLAIAGRIPSYEETLAYLENDDSAKLSALVDHLLDSPAHDSATFNWWADLLRLQTRQRGGNQVGAGEAYVHWVKDAVRQNLPFDEVARRLITAEGYPWEDGAVGYYLRDAGMPLDNMSNTTQVFLGTQMVCAQCHNHPFDKWTQMEYYKMAAYTYGVRDRVNNPKQRELQQAFYAKTRGLSREERAKLTRSREFQQLRRATGEMMRPLQYGADRTERKLQLPHDYQYEDAKPKDVIAAAPIFGQAIAPAEGEDAVDAYAQWMTASDNPRFTKVIANRMWKRVFGVGVFEPVDDLRDDTVPSNPELLEHLEALMVRLDYDLKQFARVLYNVKAFSREASAEEITVDKPYHFPGPALARMSAEQLWDSFVTLALPYPDERLLDRARLDYRMEQLAVYEEKMEKLDAKKLTGLAKKGAKASKAIAAKMERIQKQMAEAAENDDREAMARLRREYGQVRNEQRTSFAKLVMGDDFDVRSLYGYGRGNGASAKRDPRWAGFSSQLMRASELPTPAPPGHFLREFGQSDREVIENASREASVPQALTLLNGVIYREVYRQNSPLSENVVRAQTPKDKVRVLFLSILNREPTAEESETCLVELKEALAQAAPQPKVPEHLKGEKRKKYLRYLDKKRQTQQTYGPVAKAYQGIAWALLNTRQFSFVQ